MTLTIEQWEEKIKRWDLYPEAVHKIVEESSKEELERLIILLVHYVGLTNEIGELGGKIKKIIRDEKRIPILRDLGLAKESSDGEWYLTSVEHDLGYRKNEIININNDKLSKREEKGKLPGSGDDRENV